MICTMLPFTRRSICAITAYGATGLPRLRRRGSHVKRESRGKATSEDGGRQAAGGPKAKIQQDVGTRTLKPERSLQCPSTAAPDSCHQHQLRMPPRIDLHPNSLVFFGKDQRSCHVRHTDSSNAEALL